MAFKMDKTIPSFPFRHVPISARQEIADILDPYSSCGLSWEFLADKLNPYYQKSSSPHNLFSTTKIKAIDDRARHGKYGSPTLEILDILSSGNIITTDIVQQVLIEMGSAASDILPKYIQEISNNAINDKYPIPRNGHPHSCHCDSCIEYCDSLPGRRRHHTCQCICQLCQPNSHPVSPSRQLSEPYDLRNRDRNPNTERVCERRDSDISLSSANGWKIPVPERRRCFSGSSDLGNPTCRNNNLGQGKRKSGASDINLPISDLKVNEVAIPTSSSAQMFTSTTTSNNCSNSTYSGVTDSEIVNEQKHLLKEGVSKLTTGTNKEKNVYIDANFMNKDYWIRPDESDFDSDAESDQDVISEQTKLVEMRHHENANLMPNEENTNMMPRPRNSFLVSTDVKNNNNSMPVCEECICSQGHHEGDQNRHSDPISENPHQAIINRKSLSDTAINEREKDVCTCGTGRRKIKIFISFALDNDKHFKEVFQMQKKLFQTGSFEVKSDISEKSLRSRVENTHDWLEKEFESSDYVIFCISPKYFEYTQSDPNDHCDAEPTSSRLHTRFIFDLARSEFIHNHSRNKRFLPVIFTNSGANVDHLPNFMRSTIWYFYPNFENLLHFLKTTKNYLQH